jgi:tetratricopeptide (TPR) repeat protein
VYVTHLLADVVRIEGDYGRAGQLYEAVLAHYRQLGLVETAAILHNLGYTALAQGDITRANALFQESLVQQRELENIAGVAEGLAGFAAVAAAQGDVVRAVRLFAAAKALWETHNIPIWPAERVEYERHLARTNSQLDPKTWQQAWEEGRAMRMEQAIAYALGDGASMTFGTSQPR